MTAPNDVLGWLAQRAMAHSFSVNRIPISELDGWHLEEGTGNLRHHTGRFFSIEGLAARVDVPGPAEWTQPVVHQPEVGTVGFLMSRNPAPAVLTHAKMEPGNAGIVQLSPTLQATRSNYTRAHGGRAPDYLDHFLNAGPRAVLASRELSEQGSRFYRKRNRNTLVEVADRGAIPPSDDFLWVALDDMLTLLRQDGVVNMDARSILASAPAELLAGTRARDDFAVEIRRSLEDPDTGADTSIERQGEWFREARASQRRVSSLIPLSAVSGWRVADSIDRGEAGPFEIIGVRVVAPSREVSSWSQPLVHQTGSRTIALICQRRNGVVHCLIQAIAEPGGASPVEIAPTVHLHPEYDAASPFARLLELPGSAAVRFSASLPEEGGRFFHTSNRYMIAEVDGGIELDLPPHYRWVTPGQLKRFIDEGLATIEIRTLFLALLAS